VWLIEVSFSFREAERLMVYPLAFVESALQEPRKEARFIGYNLQRDTVAIFIDEGLGLCLANNLERSHA